MTAVTERTYPAKDEYLAEALGFVEGKLEEAGCPMREQMQIAVCVEETFVNVAHYAYRGTEGTVKIGLGIENGLVTIVFTDSGIPFDPLAKEDPDITLSADDRKIGGLGIFMVKKSMTDVRYVRENDKNVFTMTKEIG